MTLLRYSILLCSLPIAIGSPLSEVVTENVCPEPNWFQCDDGKCLARSFVCDGDDDCDDKTDEINCPDRSIGNVNGSCASDEFKCADGSRCISLDDFCDDMHDCSDGSDEYEGCTLNKTCGEFRCKNGYCVKNDWVCDGVNDCSDSSDEVNCDDKPIPPEQCNNQFNRFLCDNWRCISLNKTCNGINDCGDGSDEHEKGCKIAEESCKEGNGCGQMCNRTPNGPSCSCRAGYKLINDRNCKDINECDENSELCDQRCINTAGSYKCICVTGYELLDDNKTCRTEEGDALMIFSSTEEIRGFYLKSRIYFPIEENLHDVRGVSLDGNYIYWSDIEQGDETIFRSNQDGSNVKVIVSVGLGSLGEIAIDWITGNIYFTDNSRKHIGVCNTDGSYCTVLMSDEMDMPHGLALHPSTGEMFWTDFGSKPQISTATMDGKHRRILISENLLRPDSLTIDYPNRRLYWVDAKRETVESVRLDGTDRRQVLRTTATRPLSIAIFENKFYWSDWQTKTVQSANKYTGKNRTTIVREKNIIRGIHIYHPVLKPKLSNPCKIEPCSELCLLGADRTYTCACTFNKKLGDDGRSCEPTKIRQRLVIAAGNSFVNYDTGIIGRTDPIAKTILRRITHTAYDPITDTVVVADQLDDYIFRYDPRDYSITEIIDANDDYIGGLGFDHYGNNVYWSDVRNRRIKIHSVVSNATTVFRFDDEPRDILLVPEHGVMYVVFRSTERYRIDKLRMNSPIPRSKIADDLRGPKISMAYDADDDRIFWSDEGTGCIESVFIGGSDRKIFRTGLREPVGMAVMDRYVFWILGKSKRLQWAEKTERIMGVDSLTVDFSNYAGFVVNLLTMSGVDDGNRHRCRNDNGDCSHVCLVDATEQRICGCPTGMILDSDKRNCSMKNVCTSDEIRCSDDNACISKMMICNGIRDCPNGDDEKNCDPTKICEIGEFTCKNGQCTDAKNRCDSHFDCADKSDETNCDKNSCKNDEFECSDGQCISKFFVCDGRNDCRDFSDEIDCRRRGCDEGSFRCSFGNCIPESWICDGKNDCDDGSDESTEKCEARGCSENMFRCANKRCLGRALLCDDTDDCGDNSDEKNCNETSIIDGGFHSCATNEFKCRGVEMCIPLDSRCNGKQDCPKNDDEHHCAKCGHDEFACRTNKCIPQSWVCDRWDDCGDMSDEKNCESQNVENFTTATNKIPNCEQFRCTIGSCLPYEKVCDGVRDCFDGTDEDGECRSSCNSINLCEQVCQKTPSGPLCLCREGFAPDKDGKSCRDIDECDQAICPQICRNVPGSFQCMCNDGYVLESNRISCRADGEPMAIITATKTDIRKISANLTSIEVIHRQPHVDITGLDVNTIQETVYWSNELHGTINRANLRTKDFKFMSSLGRPGLLSVDWSSDNVYFHDADKPSLIKVCNFDEEKCANIVVIEGSAKLTAIAVDPKNGWLFWGQASFELFEDPIGEIYRTDMTGSNQRIIAHEKLGLVTGITIDQTRSRLYWVDALFRVVERSNLDGKNRKIFLKQQIHQPLGINIFEDSIYVLIGTSGILKKCDIHGKKICNDINVRPTNVNELFVISQKSRQPNVKNVCQNHECDYMCVPRMDKFACICPNGYTIAPNVTCDKDTNVTGPVEFESTVLGFKKKSTARKPERLILGFLITVLSALAGFSAYGYCQVKKLEARNKENSRTEFQNPSYERSVNGLPIDFVLSARPPGANEFTNPMIEVPADMTSPIT